MLNIVLTGATGFVGQTLLKTLDQLPKNTVTVKALVRSPESEKLPSFVEVVKGSLPHDIPANLFFDGPHVLIHLGIKQIDDDGKGFDDINVLGTQKLLEKSNENTLGIIYGSTLSVQGQKPQTGVSELEPLKPSTKLARSRADAEGIVTSFMKNQHKWAFNLRPRFILGDGDKYVMPGLIKLAKKGIFIGDGKQKYSVITVNDYGAIISELTHLILEQSNKSHTPQQLSVNVGYQKPLSFDQIFKCIRNHENCDTKLKRLRFPKWFPRLLKCAPSKMIESKATQLELIGFDHYGNVDRLRQLIGLDIIEQNSLEKFKALLD